MLIRTQKGSYRCQAQHLFRRRLTPRSLQRLGRSGQAKAKIAGKKMAQTKRSGGGSVRLKGAQIKRAKQKGPSFKAKMKAKAPIKSRIVKPKR